MMVTMNCNVHPLDNVVWTALTTRHASVALGRGLARHYPRDMTPFSALAEPTARAYADLAEALDPTLEARLFRQEEEPTPDGWETLSTQPILQMLGQDCDVSGVVPPHGYSMAPLTSADAADMLVLAEITKPGPVGARTVALGNYIGIREQSTGYLVAMAGERFRLPGYVELSAICVHPDARGRGLARTVTSHLLRQAQERGEIPFLHVFPDNPAASLYARWGFRPRTQLYVIWRRPRSSARH